MSAAEIAVLVVLCVPLVAMIVHEVLWAIAQLMPEHRPWMCRVGAHMADPSPRASLSGWTWVRCPACGAEDIA